MEVTYMLNLEEEKKALLKMWGEVNSQITDEDLEKASVEELEQYIALTEDIAKNLLVIEMANKEGGE